MNRADVQDRIAEWQLELNGSSAQEVLRWVATAFPGRTQLASSLGLEDQVLVDMTAREKLEIPIFTIDTGRLFSEAYDLIARTEKKYGVKMQVYFPDAGDVEKMIAEHGVNLFCTSVELRKLCCRVRKVEPLRRALSGLDAWVCGLRRDQSVTREELQVVEWDGANELVKVNPLVDWSEGEVRNYVREGEIPYNPLHDTSYPSIGCACCTRAVEPGEDVRAGRWWWETPEKKECGLHWDGGKLVCSRAPRKKEDS